MTLLKPNHPVFIFDVESIGLYGDPFAVAGGVFVNGEAIDRTLFCFSCSRETAKGYEDDREWVDVNVPDLPITDYNPYWMRESFWRQLTLLKKEFALKDIAGECIFPVETNFLASCIKQNTRERKWSGAYPFHEIASFMTAAGMDPMDTYPRLEGEEIHNPLGDIKLSARLLFKALTKLNQ